jgi:hypothetical protein
MGLLVAWISRDQNRSSAVYIVADSRITAGGNKWNRAKKVFSCKTQPWIFGFCGSVLIPTQVLAELTDAIDSGLAINSNQEPAENWESVRKYVEQALSGSEAFLAKARSYIFGFHRVNDASFDAGYYTLDGTTVAFTHVTNESKESAIIKILGSGQRCYEEVLADTLAQNASINVARIFFASFCRSLQSGKIDSIGGAPQLASLRTKGVGHLNPVLFEKCMFHQGVETDVKAYAGECFDETFQRIDPKTGEMPKDAQRQPLR